MGWTFEHFDTWEAVLAPEFQERWLRWGAEAQNAHVFLQAPVALSWIETYRPLRDISPRVVVARKADCKVFMPLVLWRKNWKHAGCRHLTMLGSSDFDYLDPFVSTKSCHFDWKDFLESALGYIFEVFRNDFDVFELSAIRSETTGNYSGFSAQDICPYLNLEGFKEPSDFWDWMESGQRSEIRRRSRKLESCGSTEFHSYQPNELADAVRSLQEMLVHHRLRWPGAYKAPNFHVDLLRNLLPAKLLHFSDLRVGGVPVSWRIGFTHNKRFYSYMPAFKQEFAGFSPGIIHLVKIIEMCISDGFAIYDYLRGGENYKKQWMSGCARVYSLTQLNKTRFSTLRGLADRALSVCARKITNIAAGKRPLIKGTEDSNYVP